MLTLSPFTPLSPSHWNPSTFPERLMFSEVLLVSEWRVSGVLQPDDN